MRIKEVGKGIRALIYLNILLAIIFGMLLAIMLRLG